MQKHSKTCKVALFEVSNDPKQISAAARTINVSFSDDPLISWLLPGVQKPWVALDPQILKLQERRVQFSRLTGLVFQSASVAEIEEEIRQEADSETFPSTTEQSLSRIPVSDSGAVVILSPPDLSIWTWYRIWGLTKLLLSTLFDKKADSGLCKKRVKIMTKAHGAALEKARRSIPDSKIWYLEVVGVHPSLQGKGVGRSAMQRAIEIAGANPIVLECTSQTNIQFYERLGFEVIEEAILKDTPALTGDSGKVTLWIMLRR